MKENVESIVLLCPILLRPDVLPVNIFQIQFFSDPTPTGANQETIDGQTAFTVPIAFDCILEEPSLNFHCISAQLLPPTKEE